MSLAVGIATIPQGKPVNLEGLLLELPEKLTGLVTGLVSEVASRASKGFATSLLARAISRASADVAAEGGELSIGRKEARKLAGCFIERIAGVRNPEQILKQVTDFFADEIIHAWGGVSREEARELLEEVSEEALRIASGITPSAGGFPDYIPAGPTSISQGPDLGREFGRWIIGELPPQLTPSGVVLLPSPHPGYPWSIAVVTSSYGLGARQLWAVVWARNEWTSKLVEQHGEVFSIPRSIAWTEGPNGFCTLYAPREIVGGLLVNGPVVVEGERLVGFLPARNARIVHASALPPDANQVPDLTALTELRDIMRALRRIFSGNAPPPLRMAELWNLLGREGIIELVLPATAAVFLGYVLGGAKLPESITSVGFLLLAGLFIRQLVQVWRYLTNRVRAVFAFPIIPGDPASVVLNWVEVLEAAYANRDREGNIIERPKDAHERARQDSSFLERLCPGLGSLSSVRTPEYCLVVEQCFGRNSRFGTEVFRANLQGLALPLALLVLICGLTASDVHRHVTQPSFESYGITRTEAQQMMERLEEAKELMTALLRQVYGENNVKLGTSADVIELRDPVSGKFVPIASEIFLQAQHRALELLNSPQITPDAFIKALYEKGVGFQEANMQQAVGLYDSAEDSNRNSIPDFVEYTQRGPSVHAIVLMEELAKRCEILLDRNSLSATPVEVVAAKIAQSMGWREDNRSVRILAKMILAWFGGKQKEITKDDIKYIRGLLPSVEDLRRMSPAGVPNFGTPAGGSSGETIQSSAETSAETTEQPKVGGRSSRRVKGYPGGPGFRRGKGRFGPPPREMGLLPQTVSIYKKRGPWRRLG